MHPLPGDFSRKGTYEIVEKIRCEGAEAIRGIPKDHPFLRTAFIGYDFDFHITETNDIAGATSGGRGKLTFTDKHKATSKIEIEGAAERERKAQRTFRIIESLEQLRTADCSSEKARENWVYPITGSIGMYEIVRTYVGLERLTTLVSRPRPGPGAFGGADKPLPPGVTGDAPVVFSDVLEYTTSLGVGVRPTIELNASGIGKFRLSGLSLFGDASRVDVHKLTVVLTRDSVGATTEPPKFRSLAANTRSMNTKTKEDEYKEAIRSYQTNPTNNLSNNLLTNGLLNTPNGTRYIRTLDALQQKQLPADSRIFVELERRRAAVEDEAFLSRVIEILKLTP
jgi:hypothetical protein